MNGITTAFSGRRGLALGAVVVLLLAALAGFGQQAAKANINSPITISVADVSPPPGGEIYYAITVNGTTAAAPNDFALEATNVSQFSGHATPVGIDSANITVTAGTNTSAFGVLQVARWDVTQSASGTTQTFYVGLQLRSDVAVGTSFQPTFKLCQDTSPHNQVCDPGELFITLTPPARTVGPLATVSPTGIVELTGDDTVTFTLNLPANWTCGTDSTLDDATRDCPGTGLVTGLTVLSVSGVDPNIANPSTVTIVATGGTPGTTSAQVSVAYVGVTTSPVVANDNLSLSIPTTPITVVDWLDITTAGLPAPIPYQGASGTMTVTAANLTGVTVPPGGMQLVIELGDGFASVSSLPTGCTASGLTVTCSNTTPVTSGSTYAPNFNVTVGPNLGNSSRTFTATATLSFPSLGVADRTETRSFTQNPSGVTVSVTSLPVALDASGGTAVFTVQVNVPATVTIANSQLEFTAPAGTTAVSAVSASGFSCTVVDSDTVTCTQGAGTLSNTTVTVAQVAVAIPANATNQLLTHVATAQVTFNTTAPAAVSGVTATGTGTVFQTPGAGTVTYNLVFGWNLITWNGQNNVAVNSPNGLGSIAGQFSAVYTFDAPSQQWRFWFPGGDAVNTLTTLQTGTAYFIYVTAQGGATPTVPAGP